MKPLLKVLTILTVITSTQCFGFQPGKYYNNNYPIQDICKTVRTGSSLYTGRATCQKICQRAVWNKMCGPQYANAFVCDSNDRCTYKNSDRSGCVWVFNWISNKSAPYTCW